MYNRTLDEPPLSKQAEAATTSSAVLERTVRKTGSSTKKNAEPSHGRLRWDLVSPAAAHPHATSSKWTNTPNKTSAIMTIVMRNQNAPQRRRVLLVVFRPQVDSGNIKM